MHLLLITAIVRCFQASLLHLLDASTMNSMDAYHEVLLKASERNPNKSGNDRNYR